MATDLERLVVQLSADIKSYENAMRKAQGVTVKQTKAIEQTWAKSNKRVSAGFAGLGKGLAAAFAVGASLRGAQQLIDSATRIQNALKVAGLEGENLTKVYDRLFAGAQKNAAPIESLVELYSRASLSAKDLGASQEELLQFTDRIAVALRVSGQSAEQAGGALLQLSQLLGSGTVRAEEFNSVQEGALPILQAVAAGLKEAGGSVSTLRGLVIDGKVTSEAFFRAFEAGSVILDEKVAGSTVTVSQAFTQLNNTLIDTAGKLNDATGAGSGATAALGRLSHAVEVLGEFLVRVADGPLGDFIGKLGELDAKAKATFEFLSQFSFLDEIGSAIGNFVAHTPSAGPATVRVAGGKQGAVAGPIDQRIDAAFGASLNPVSLADFAAPASKKKTGRKSRESDFAREISQIKERTAAILATTAAQAGLNPLVDDYGFAVEKAAAVQELLSAAQSSGMAITPELRAQIEVLATEYASAGVAAQQLAEAQDEVRARAEEFADLGRDVMGGFIDDLVNGKSAADAFAGALSKIGDKLLDIALNSINLGSLFGGGTTAFAGGILSGARVGLFHKGGVVGAPGGQSRTVHPGVFAGAPLYHNGTMGAGLRSGEVPAILQKGEIVLPKGARSSGGGVSIDARTTINAPNADREGLARLQAVIAKRDAELPAKVIQYIRAANKQNVKFG